MRTLGLLLLLGSVGAQAGVFDVPAGGKVALPALEIPGGTRLAPLKLEPIDVYAPGARVHEMRPDGSLRELPRSRERYFVSARGETTRLWLSVSADGRSFEGAAQLPQGMRRLRGTIGPRGLRVLAASDPSANTASHCANGDGAALRDSRAGLPAPVEVRAGLKGEATSLAVVAVDTDTEFMTRKFDGDTAAATAYLGQLFAGLNAFYERDLGVRLVQGTTILRTLSDGYSSPVTEAQLNELGSAWKNSPALRDIERAFVMLLSGKSPSPTSSQGIAWLMDHHDYCAERGTALPEGLFGHYSVTQVFLFEGAGAASDVALIGHELGHNFGANHTHCTHRPSGAHPVAIDTIDQCYAGEGADGCYAGPSACPQDNSVAGRGSVMSYCNVSGCGALLEEFHPTHEMMLRQRVAANVANGCFETLEAPVPPLFRDGFE